MSNKIQAAVRSVAADLAVLGGIALAGDGIYRLWGTGVTFLAVGTAMLILGVALEVADRRTS